ncbi:uncharacterized protein LOC116413544 isoform X4 [Galleria mellonella]|uniref:Uncharacterized protein LOC116413544 isoform X4 n=1 Tax=Galleria mellonella TaxID=7137 RepID=A0ABM3N7J2_GALME|nr:uncharacterized protein LOC116413544 isoform X4 [Galleria mellonella]
MLANYYLCLCPRSCNVYICACIIFLLLCLCVYVSCEHCVNVFKHFTTKPNHYANTSVSSHNTYQEENVELIKEPEVRETTAVSMLEFVEKKGLIDRTFEARLPQPLCSLGTREYPEDDNPSNHVLVPEYASPAVENLVTAIHTPRQKYKFYARRCASGTMNIQSQWNLRDILQLSATVSCKEIPTLDGIHILAYLHYFATILSSVFTLLLYNVIILIIYSIILLLFI